MVEPPGPIPNPEVKRRSANGSETIGLARVGRRQVYARLQAIGAGLFFAHNGGNFQSLQTQFHDLVNANESIKLDFLTRIGLDCGPPDRPWLARSMRSHEATKTRSKENQIVLLLIPSLLRVKILTESVAYLRVVLPTSGRISQCPMGRGGNHLQNRLL